MRMTSIVGTLVLSLSMLGAGAQAAGAQTLKRVRVGSVGATAVNSPVCIAFDQGIFKDEGIDVRVIYVGNVANTVQQLIAGAFGIANSTFDSAIRGVAKGGDGVMIGGMTPRYPYSTMTASDVHNLAELEGRKIILPFPKDLLTIVWNRWVREQGMDPKAIDQIYDGATRNRFNALAAGAARTPDAALRLPRGRCGEPQACRSRRLRQGIRVHRHHVTPDAAEGEDTGSRLEVAARRKTGRDSKMLPKNAPNLDEIHASFQH